MQTVALFVIFRGLIFWAFLEGKDLGSAPASLINTITILLLSVFYSFFFPASISFSFLSLFIFLTPSLL